MIEKVERVFSFACQGRVTLLDAPLSKHDYTSQIRIQYCVATSTALLQTYREMAERGDVEGKKEEQGCNGAKGVLPLLGSNQWQKFQIFFASLFPRSVIAPPPQRSTFTLSPFIHHAIKVGAPGSIPGSKLFKKRPSR